MIGIVAALCTTIAFVPQVVKIYRTKHTKDLSLAMYVVFSVGVLLWMFFGILTRTWPIIIANALVFVMCGYVLFMKLKYK